jgi:outer membrane beta-barrel protein
MNTRGLLKLAAAAATAVGLMATPSDASAQEIQLTGPLAGAPACRHCRLYRDGRFSATPGMGVTLLNEYERTFFPSVKLEYNLFDFLGIGFFGAYGLNDNTDLTNKIQATAPRNSRTATNLAPTNGPAFDSQTGKLKLMLNPQLTFSPFRGKLAIFQKLFVDTDLYIHLGTGFVQVQERSDCGGGGQVPCSGFQNGQFNAAAYGTQTRFAWAPITGGLGLTLYASGFISMNIEYRAFPFSWNRGGFDSRGAPPNNDFPDNKVDSQDRTFNFNQMVFLGVGFYLPTAPKVSD